MIAAALAERAAAAGELEDRRAEEAGRRYDAMTEDERARYHEGIALAKLDRPRGTLAPESLLCSGDVAARTGGKGRGWFRVILTPEGSRVIDATQEERAAETAPRLYRCLNQWHYGTIGPVFHVNPDGRTAWSGYHGAPTPNASRLCDECAADIRDNYPRTNVAALDLSGEDEADAPTFPRAENDR